MTTPIFQARQAYYLPRPDRLYHQITFRRRPPKIDMGLLRDILADYGIAARGKIEVPGGPGRSDNVIVETAAGKKLLKRYKDTITPAAALHEHSILVHLAQVGFPSPRLARTTSGETLIQHDGKCYAMFDFIEGYFHYHNYFLLPAQAQRFIATSGRALGALHNVLADFSPAGDHPSGFKSRGEDRWRELSWFTDMLEECRQKLPQLQGADANLMRQMLAEHADRVEGSLRRLDATLAAAAPARLIIHGDYGPYNLLFRRGAPVVILDFELARLDWRLTDLSTALPSFARSRLGFSFQKMKCFLEGYRTSCPIDRTELSLLPSVWQFLTLRRVVVGWQRFCSTGSGRWLVEAQQKLELAGWLAENQRTLSGQLGQA
jgi:Ser/Thr protein kinase RdoA (MazF antagonist)